MRDDEKLGSLLLVLTIGLMYQAIASCKGLCSFGLSLVPTIKSRWPD